MAKLQSMDSYNKNFTSNNPQFGVNPKGNPNGLLGQTLANSKIGVSAPKPGQSAYVDPTNPTPSQTLGQRAKSPVANITAPKNTLATGQVAPPTPTQPTQTPPPAASNSAAVGNTGLIGSPTALAGGASGAVPTYGGLISRLSDYSTNTAPGVQDALKNQRDFETSYARGQMARSNTANPFGYETNLMNINSAGHAALAPVYQKQVEQAYTGAGQGLQALGAATSAAAPVQVAPGNFYLNPATGNDVTGGAVSPFAGGQRQGQVAAGNTYQANLPVIGTAKSFASDFSNTLQGANLNTADLNAANWLQNVYAANTSNPAFPRLQSSFNNALSQYAKVFGTDPQTLANSLLPLAQGQTINSLLADLDAKANRYNENIRATGQGGQANTAATSPALAGVQAGANQNGHAPGSQVSAADGGVYQVNQDGSYTRIK